MPKKKANPLMAMVKVAKEKKPSSKKPTMTKAMKSTGSIMASIKKGKKGC